MELAISKFIKSNASQDFIDVTAANYDVFTAILAIFSM